MFVTFPNEDDAPPTERARRFSDADQASAHQIMAHVRSLCLMHHRWYANIVVSPPTLRLLV